MQQEKPTALLASLFSPRNLIFAVMALATAAYILQRAEGTNLGEGVADKLRDKQFRLVVRMFVYQAALARTNPEPVRTQLANQLVTQLDQLEATGEFFEGPRLLQKFIVLGYLGRSPAVKVIPPIVARLPEYSDYQKLFRGGQIVAADSPIFAGAAGDAALVHQLRLQKDDARAAELEAKMRTKIVVFGALGLAFFVGMFLLYVTALGLIFLKRPTRRYPLIQRMLLPETRDASLRAVVLHLFLSLPVTGALAFLLPNVSRLVLAGAGVVLAFCLSLAYFVRTTNWHQLRMIVHAEPGMSVAKEIAVGLLGFSVIFPGAVAVLLLTLAVVEPQDGLRAAHPLVNELQSGFWLPLLLAAIIAPIVEETIFRGFLYGYMRNFFGALGSALLTGLVFALLHPQGMLALPYLTVLGGGLAILRELRPGLIAPMTVHAAVNTLAVCSAYMLLNF